MRPLRGLFQILMNEPEGLSVKELMRRLEEILPPNEHESSCYPNKPGVRRYEKMVRFSSINIVKAGWLIKNKGFWSLTEEGRRAFERYPDPETFFRESSRLYRKWKANQPVPEDESEEEETGQAVMALEEAEETAWAEIEEVLVNMNPYDFQELVAGLLRGMGYFVNWVAPPGPDKGTDIVAHVDPLGVKGPRIKVQVKRRNDSTAVNAVRGFMATLGDNDVGIFVCTGGFTREAESEARGQEKRRIMLLDLKKLFDLWTEHYSSIPEQQRRLLPLRAVYYLAPDE